VKVNSDSNHKFQSKMQDEFFQASTYSNYDEFMRMMTKYFNLDNPAPYISSRSWVMTDLDTGDVMFAK